MANRVLGLQRERTASGDLGLRHQRLVHQHVTNCANIRVGVHLGVDRLLLGQFSGLGQVMHDLVNIRRNGLRDLEPQAEPHTEDVVGAEILHRVFAGERLIGGLHTHCPPCAGALGVVGEDGEEDIRIESLGLRIGSQVDDVVRKVGDAEVSVQLVECGQEVLGPHVATLRTLQLGAFVPRVHDKQNRDGEQAGEPTTMQELGHGGDEEHDLDGQEQHGEHDGAHALAVIPEIHAEQHGGGDHGDGQRQAVCGGDVLRILEDGKHGQSGDAQHAVDHRNVQLAACTGRVTHLQMRHPVEAGGLGNHGECAGDQGLGGNHAGRDGENHRQIAHVRRHHLEERVQRLHSVELRVAGVVQHPRALAEVVEHQRNLDEWPGEVDVATAHMAHVGVERLGTGGGEEHRAHQCDTGRVMRAEQEFDAVHRVKGGEHRPVVVEIHHAHNGEEAEPDQHHRAEDLADAFGATRLHGEQNHDDHHGDHEGQARILVKQLLERRQSLQTFDCGADGHGRCEHGIGQEGRAAEHGGNGEPGSVFADQRVECKDAAFAVVVDAHGNQHIFDGGNQRNRPEDQREHTEHGLAIHVAEAALPGKEGLRGVQRRGTDVAIDHAKGHNRHAPRDLIRSGLQASPPTAKTAFGRGAGDFLGFSRLGLALFGDGLALLLGEGAAGNLGSVSEGVGPQQGFFFLLSLCLIGTSLGISFLGLLGLCRFLGAFSLFI